MAGYIVLVILSMFSHAPFFPVWLWTHDFKKENWFNLILWLGNNIILKGSKDHGVQIIVQPNAAQSETLVFIQ